MSTCEPVCESTRSRVCVYVLACVSGGGGGGGGGGSRYWQLQAFLGPHHLAKVNYIHIKSHRKNKA